MATHFERKENAFLDEYKNAIQTEKEKAKEEATKPKTSELLRRHERDAKQESGTVSLADLKRKQNEDNQDALDRSHYKRFKIINMTNEDAQKFDDVPLRTAYCSICGSIAVVSQTRLHQLPKRKTDDAYCFPEGEGAFLKIYLKEGDLVRLKRPGGVESQQRLTCKECKQVMGYRSAAKTPSPFCYIYAKAVVQEQSSAVKFATA